MGHYGVVMGCYGAVMGCYGAQWVPLMGRCGAAPQAIFKMIPEEERLQLPEDENSPQKRADKLWAYFNKGENGETRSPTAPRDPTQPYGTPQSPMGPHKPLWDPTNRTLPYGTPQSPMGPHGTL